MYYDQAGESPYGMNVRRMDSAWRLACDGIGPGPVRDSRGWVSRAARYFAARFAQEHDYSDSGQLSICEGLVGQQCAQLVHNGSLPGTSSIMVRTGSGFGWAALANWREKSADTGARSIRPCGIWWEKLRDGTPVSGSSNSFSTSV